MKVVTFYDANVFRMMKLEEIQSFLDGHDNYITDDVAKELIEAKKNDLSDMEQKKISLVFNEIGGLNDNLSLVLSHIPVGLESVYENTKNRVFPKANALLCSTHHLWLPMIASPALVTDPSRHKNSELTWRLKIGDITDNRIIDNYKSKLRTKEINRIKPLFTESSLKPSKIIYPWAKRDTEIKKGKYKISDSRLVMHAFSAMLYKGCDVNILTADYDLIDLTANLLASLVDLYVINEVLTEYCKDMALDLDKHTTLDISKSLFYETHKKVLDKIDSSKECLKYTILFYKNNGHIEPQHHFIPNWLLDFSWQYKLNVPCSALDGSIYNKYPIQYIWISDWREDVDTIMFKVWRRCDDKRVKKEPFECMFSCGLEFHEINDPISLSAFIRPNEEK